MRIASNIVAKSAAASWSKQPAACSAVFMRSGDQTSGLGYWPTHSRVNPITKSN